MTTNSSKQNINSIIAYTSLHYEQGDSENEFLNGYYNLVTCKMNSMFYLPTNIFSYYQFSICKIHIKS